MSLGQWVAVCEVQRKASQTEPDPPTDDEFEQALERAREITGDSN